LNDDINNYIQNQAALKVQKANIIKRLSLGLENLKRNQAYMNEQMESFNTYLKVAQEKQQATKGKGKKSTKSAKFSYSKLAKSGVIVSSSVPEKARKQTFFTIAQGDNTNEFHVKAKIAGFLADKIVLILDDLLEKQSQNVQHLELDDITLDVNLTISLINKTFLTQQK